MREHEASGVPEKAVDPVSGREVLTTGAPTAAHKGRIFYFESAESRQRFEAAQQQYAPKQSPPPQQQRHRGCC
jgi:YHS domain-containing protein